MLRGRPAAGSTGAGQFDRCQVARGRPMYCLLRVANREELRPQHQAAMAVELTGRGAVARGQETLSVKIDAGCRASAAPPAPPRAPHQIARRKVPHLSADSIDVAGGAMLLHVGELVEREAARKF